ncbi:MAG: GTPase Era [Pseudomonadota bacterium]
MTDSATSCGFVALLGAPNAGKSTLLNAVVGAKVSIVTPKVQTTRTRITGIRIVDRAQLIFVDTPGIFAPKRRLERAMVEAAWAGLDGADVAVLLIDAIHGIDKNTRRILQRLAERERPFVVALNKVDKVAKHNLLPLAAAINEGGQADEIFMISALQGDGIEDLLQFLVGRMPPGPWLYPEEQISDVPMRMMAAEITREKLFLALHQELPYGLSVETEMWTEIEDEDAVRIDQIIYVAKDGHKPIVLGKGGQMLKRIGTTARKELETILGCRVHLFLHVKVRPNWLDEPARYREMGLEFPRQ